MAHGAPDFGMYAPKITVGSLADMGELAARLKSIVTLDRRGDVIFLEDFEAPILNWTKYGVAAGAAQRLYPDEAFMGSQSLYLSPGDAAEDKSGIIRRFHSTANQKYGIEVMTRELTSHPLFDIELYVNDGTIRYWSELRYDPSNDILQILDSGGEFKTIATVIRASAASGQWWPMKLVIDSKTGKYVRGIFLGVEYDLSTEVMKTDTISVFPFIQVSIEVVNALGVAAEALFDNIIITQNEP